MKKPPPPPPDFQALFRVRLERLLGWLRTTLVRDADVVLVMLADERTWETAASQMAGERAMRPHLWPQGQVTSTAPAGVTTPLTVGAALELVTAGLDSMAHHMAEQVLMGAPVFVDKKLLVGTFARTEILVGQWPRPLADTSVAAYALTALTTATQELPPGELIPDRHTPGVERGPTAYAVYWPPGAAPLDVVRWARVALNRIQPGAGDLALADVERGHLALPDITLSTPGRSPLLIQAACLAVLHLAEADVRTGLARPAFAVDAHKEHHDLVTGWRDYPKEGPHHRGAPPTLRGRIIEGKVRIELLMSGHPVQLVLPVPEFQGLHASTVQALRDLLGAEGLRHYVAWLRLLSVEGGRRGWVRYSVDDHLSALGYHERKQRDPELRARAAHYMEMFTDLEVALYDETDVCRARAPLIHVGARYERREGADFKLEGMELKANEFLYKGVRTSTDEIGRLWMPAPVDLAKVSHRDYPHIHTMGLLFAIRIRWGIAQGDDHIALSGENLLRFGGFRVQPHDPGRVWRHLQDHLDKLVEIGQLSHYQWSPLDDAWSLAGICRLYPAEWSRDRVTRGLIPTEKPTDPDKPITGIELKRWRESRGWSQREAAKRLTVTNGAISQAEARPTEPLGYKLRAAFQQALEPTEPNTSDKTTQGV